MMDDFVDWLEMADIERKREREVIDMDYDKYIENLNWLRSLIQELHDDNIELPIGSYDIVYDMIEDVREYFEMLV